jgi:trehalose-6-phosphate synthase
MGRDERRRRIHRMRMQLYQSTIFNWLESILARAAEVMEEQSREAAR